jgi:integrase
MVMKKQKELTQRGKTLANAAMRVLRLLMNYAELVGVIEKNPVNIISKGRMWHKNNRKDRVIPSNKLKEWHEAVLSLDNYKASVYLLSILYMGLRSSEALSMEWEHINIRGKALTVFDTKNGSDQTLPIPDVLIPHLKALKGITGSSKWVFPATDESQHMWLPKKPIAQVVSMVNFEFSSHDCRRTFATIAEAVNLPLTMIKRLMNHVTSGDVTGGYIVTEEDTLREAINKIADYIQARVTKKENVVQLRK